MKSKVMRGASSRTLCLGKQDTGTRDWLRFGPRDGLYM